VDHSPCRSIPGAGTEDPELFAVVGIALIVTVELPDVAPAAIVPGFTEQVAPVSDCGTAQVTVIAEGNGALAGLGAKSIFTMAGVPAITAIVPGVEASCVRVMPTIPEATLPSSESV